MPAYCGSLFSTVPSTPGARKLILPLAPITVSPPSPVVMVLLPGPPPMIAFCPSPAVMMLPPPMLGFVLVM